MDYYDSEKVKANGRTIPRLGDKQPRIPTGQRLIAIMDNAMWKACPDVTDLNEYQTFYDAYYQGFWISMDLFLVPEANLADCK